MHHGWMGARAKLGEEENLKEYTRGRVLFLSAVMGTEGWLKGLPWEEISTEMVNERRFFG
jgi:hypothetical protein